MDKHSNAMSANYDCTGRVLYEWNGTVLANVTLMSWLTVVSLRTQVC
jgi:hypothetical protein